MVEKILPAWPTSPPPFEKKKLAPREPCSKYSCAIVRATLDFAVPASPLSQYMRLSFCPSAHALLSLRTLTRVSCRHIGSCCLSDELKATWVALGNLSNRSSCWAISGCGIGGLYIEHRRAVSIDDFRSFLA